MSVESRRFAECVKVSGHPGSGGPHLADRSQSPSPRQAEPQKQPGNHSLQNEATPPPKLNSWRCTGATKSSDPVTNGLHQSNTGLIYSLSPPRLDTTMCPSTLIGGAASSAHCNAMRSQSEHWDRSPPQARQAVSLKSHHPELPRHP